MRPKTGCDGIWNGVRWIHCQRCRFGAYRDVFPLGSTLDTALGHTDAAPTRRPSGPLRVFTRLLKGIDQAFPGRT